MIRLHSTVGQCVTPFPHGKGPNETCDVRDRCRIHVCVHRCMLSCLDRYHPCFCFTQRTHRAHSSRVHSTNRTQRRMRLLLNCVHTNASKHSLAVDDDDDDDDDDVLLKQCRVSAVWETAAVQWHVSVLEPWSSAIPKWSNVTDERFGCHHGLSKWNVLISQSQDGFQCQGGSVDGSTSWNNGPMFQGMTCQCHGQGIDLGLSLDHNAL